MDVVLAVDLVQDRLTRLIWHIGPDLVTPLDSPDNLATLFTVENDGTLGREYISVTIGSDAKSVALVGSLSDRVEVAGVTQVEATVDVASVFLDHAWLLRNGAIAGNAGLDGFK